MWTSGKGELLDFGRILCFLRLVNFECDSAGRGHRQAELWRRAGQCHPRPDYRRWPSLRKEKYQTIYNYIVTDIMEKKT